MREAVIGALVVAAASTLGDFIWAMWIPRHLPVYGLTHGTLLFLAVGWYLGRVTGRPLAGTIGGGLVGFAAAGSFYVIAPLAGYSAMFVSYFGVWIALALLVAWLSGARVSSRDIVLRGMAAAVGSALAFYAVSGIWFPFRPRGWDYAVHFASWTIAYLPGMIALLWRPARVGATENCAPVTSA
jgi:hypothetical protein